MIRDRENESLGPRPGANFVSSRSTTGQKIAEDHDCTVGFLLEWNGSCILNGRRHEAPLTRKFLRSPSGIPLRIAFDVKLGKVIERLYFTFVLPAEVGS